MPGDDAGELGVPGVGVDHVHRPDRGGHRDIGAEGPDRGIGPFRVGLRMTGRPRAGLTHRLHLDRVTEVTQLGDKLADVDAGTAVDVRGIFTGEDRDAQGHD